MEPTANATSTYQDLLLALYAQNSKVAETFWGWRHKLLSLYASILIGTVTLIGFLYKHNDNKYLCVPLFVASLLSLALAAMDARNSQILHRAYASGSDLETQLLQLLPDREPGTRPLLVFQGHCQ